MRKHGNLQRAWQTIKSNGRRSSSPYVVNDIANFTETEQTNIRSISSKIQHQTYVFSPARGVAIEKPNKPGNIRPIVIPRAHDRVVQRCILNALACDSDIAAEAFQPLSFGGVPKRKGQPLSGVPAAIAALLQEIQAGGTHVIVADISSFFTRISKADAVSRIARFTDDKRFLSLFAKAIEVDLDNHAKLWRYKDNFPYQDLGVGQGVCLSPFIGNLVLADFDRALNTEDCSCIRYVDDIIIVAPSGRAASARFRQAVRLLAGKGMTFAAEKTQVIPRPVTETFEYLGIEFSSGKIRPAAKARKSIVRRSQDVAARSLRQIRQCKKPSEFDTEFSIPETLRKISGMSKGWTQHYTFCNDIETIKNVDRQICSSFLDYANKAISLTQERMQKQPDAASVFFGYQGAAGVKFNSFEWPETM